VKEVLKPFSPDPLNACFPFAVAKILIDAGFPEDDVVAGILHDTVETRP
jgi:(p)ppGpp synthase/HD superfamily hydrolase